MNNEFPELTKEGKEKAEEVLEKFKLELKNSAVDIIEKNMGEFYQNALTYIEEDSWRNFRNDILQSICNYSETRKSFPYDAKRIRRIIFENFKDEIIQDLNQDLLDENEKLKRNY